ncbi:MAG: hypothetical protein RI897_3869 [Verrucomicrobiota bacterium]
MEDEGEDLAGGVLEGEVSVGGEGGRLGVDFDEGGAIGEGDFREGCGGVDEGGGSGGDEEVTGSAGLDGESDLFTGEGFPEPDDIGAEEALALWAAWWGRVGIGVVFYGVIFLEAFYAVEVAVEFDDLG